MDFVFELFHDETVRSAIGWGGALLVVGFWIWTARVLIGKRLAKFNKEQDEEDARARALETREAPKS